MLITFHAAAILGVSCSPFWFLYFLLRNSSIIFRVADSPGKGLWMSTYSGQVQRPRDKKQGREREKRRQVTSTSECSKTHQRRSEKYRQN